MAKRLHPSNLQYLGQKISYTSLVDKLLEGDKLVVPFLPRKNAEHQKLKNYWEELGKQ